MNDASKTSIETLALELYPELKALARVQMRRERADHTLQATALVNELYLRLLKAPDKQWVDRNHFLQAASRAMHNLLVDHARARNSQKGGGGAIRLEINDSIGVPANSYNVLDIDNLLKQLALEEPRMARIVELKFFGGLTFPEIGTALGVDARTAKRDWALARVWLRGRLEGRLEDDSGGKVDSEGMGAD